MKLHIKHGRVIDPASQLDSQQDIYIEDNTIVAISENYDGFDADHTIDATGLIVCPGLIDLSANLREPGQEQTATIASETKAAAASGITTLVVPPDTAPVIDNPSVVELIEDRTEKAGYADVKIIGALTQDLAGELLSEMGALQNAGCVGVSNGLTAIKNSVILRRAMEYAASLNLPLFINPSDPWLSKQGCVHEGSVSARLGLAGIPESAETIAVAKDLLLIEQTGVCAHFHNISTGAAVKMIADAQSRGLNVTADVSPHHLHLTEHDIGNYDNLCHVMPPLRTSEDRELLKQGLRDGVITAISSNHQPLDNDAKLAPFADSEPGISGLETLLALTMKLVDDEELSLIDAIASLTINPANIIGENSIGQLKVGAQADICIFNPNADYKCEPDTFVSAGKNTPFKGWLLNNQVIYTIFNGKITYALN
jgi:dihydroorotase